MSGLVLTVRGQVQGVGFRPTVWRLAHELGLSGDVCNTGHGVRIRLWGESQEAFLRELEARAPSLARIDRIERASLDEPAPMGFTIAPSRAEDLHACITPDAASCVECLHEVRDPFDTRFRYPFANCTNCGPRFSITTGAPYDRARTTMDAFECCPRCAAEYDDPNDRRFHAQPVACHVCGPRAWIERLGQGSVSHDAFSMLDDVDAVAGMLLKGFIVAIKGLGGFHLACDATNPETVERLRQGKRRPAKAFALMARDIEVIERYCRVSTAERALLESPAAPIVLLDLAPHPDAEVLPGSVAPGLGQLGFMLAHTPLHHLMLHRVERPIVMTSGNIAGRPQCVHNEQAREQLTAVADFALMHDRDIANRIDDSVLRVDLGQPRLLRRGRGFAPRPLMLPEGFDQSRQVLALGAELKNTFCLVKGGQAVVSQHMGDLSEPHTEDDVASNLGLYRALYHHEPDLIATDMHPSYHSSQHGRELARTSQVALTEVQHHHAHLAACMAENGYRPDQGAVLGIALDGLGYGTDGTLWGGEFLSCTYAEFERLGCFKPVPLPGASAAVREPWRNAYAHLMAEMGWAELRMNFAALAFSRKLAAAPHATLDAMLAEDMNCPLSSSCGRLFDAAAAMVGVAWDAQSYEGEAAMALEALIDPRAMSEPEDLAYPFAIPRLPGSGLPYIEPLGAWRALLGDLHLGTSPGTIAARFHRGLARTIVHMAVRLSGPEGSFSTVALSGGSFQNRTLFELIHTGLVREGFRVLSHQQVPANDGGISLGQAVVALARAERGLITEEEGTCA